MDIFQKRYIAHQKRKAKVLEEILKEKHSTRQFSSRDVDIEQLKTICASALDKSPSSCDRKAIHLEYIDDKDDKRLLSGLLVGGTGWIHRANVIVLIKADMVAFKENLDYMPYLDAGVVIQSLYLTLTTSAYKCCYVNPNIRKKHQGIFDNYFQPSFTKFCGAMAVGYEK